MAATILLQAVVIGVGWLAALHTTQTKVTGRALEEQVARNERAVSSFAQSLAAEVPGPIERDGESWKRAQRLVEMQQPGEGAVLFLLDASGRMLCHPRLGFNPNLSRADLSEQQVQTLGDEEVWELGNIVSRSVLSARAELPSGPGTFSLKWDPVRNARIVVQQTDAALLAAGRRLTRDVALWGGVATLLILALTGAGSMLLVRRYDTILMRLNGALENEVSRRTRQGLAIRNAMVFGLAKLADYRDTDTGQHLERISRYSELLACELKDLYPEIDDAWIERIRLASSMHDIGKVGIPDSILLKPGPLSPEERLIMQEHCLIGGDTLLQIRHRVGDDTLLSMCIEVAMQHHERWDGQGYPFGLSGQYIALAARIVALADMYDALTSRRVYKLALAHEEAMLIIRQARGTQFDPTVVDAFVRIHERFREASSTIARGEECETNPLKVLGTEQGPARLAA